MTSTELMTALRELDSLRSTGIHSRMAILLVTVWEEEGLKQVDYANKLNWRIQIINRYALNMEREGYVDLIHVDTDPRGRARAIVLKDFIREKLNKILKR